MERICVYPGSFDPVTLGHEDVIRRAAMLFDHLYVAVMHNPKKHGCFTLEERMMLLRKMTAGLPNVTVDCWDGLMVDYAHARHAVAVVRGLRAVSDFESEMTMSQVNSHLLPNVETIFLMTRPEHSYISSSAVREAAKFGADIRAFVPTYIADDIIALFQEKQDSKH